MSDGNSIFKITVSAVDDVTKQVKKMNNSVSSFVRPVAQVGRSFKQLGAEMGRSMPYKALAHTYKGVKAIGGVALDVGKKMTGFGLAGAAALAEMTREWTGMGAQIGRFSQQIGASTDDVQTWIGAAKLAGVESGTMTGSMKALGDTLQDALYGRNQEARATLNKLNIEIHKTADGSIDTTRALRDLAGAMADPRLRSAQTQGKVARTLGVESLLPLLRKGTAGVDEYRESVRRLGIESPAAIAASERFHEQMSKLEITTIGLRNAIGSKLIPIIEPYIEKLTQWITQNKELISQKIGDWIGKFVTWVEKLDWDEIVAGAREFGSALVDIKDALVGIGGVIKNVNPKNWTIGGVATALASPGMAVMGIGAKIGESARNSFGGSGGNGGAAALFSRLEGKYGLPSGLLDSVWAQESGRGSNMLSSAGAQGHFQFMPATQKEYGLRDPNDLEESADAAARKLSGLVRRYGGNVGQAAGAYNWGEGNVQKYGFANAPAETQKYMSDIMSRMGQPQELVVRIDGLPPGVRATVTKGGRGAPGRIGTAMPDPANG